MPREGDILLPRVKMSLEEFYGEPNGHVFTKYIGTAVYVVYKECMGTFPQDSVFLSFSS